jgi:hypothetical protein
MKITKAFVAITIAVGIAIPTIANPVLRKQVYLFYAAQDNKQAKNLRILNHEVSRTIGRNKTTNIDFGVGDELQNVHSIIATPRGIQQLDSRLQQIAPSSDLALLASLNRTKELLKMDEPLTAYIVHPGTRDPKTLSAIQKIAKEIALTKNTKFKIYLMGMSPALKIPTVSAFSPIGKQLGGSCTDDYSQCRKFLADLR